MDCLVIKLPGEVTDDSLRKLGEFIFDVTKRGDGTDYTKINIQVYNGVLSMPIVRMTNGGKIYKTIGGEALNELQLTYTGSSNNSFYIRAENDCKMRIENAVNVSRLGWGFDELVFATALSNDSPFIKFPLSDDIAVFSNLRNIYHVVQDYSGDIEYISKLKNLTDFASNWAISLEGDIHNVKSNSLLNFSCTNTSLTGDIAEFMQNCPNVNTLQLKPYSGIIEYLGDGEMLTTATLQRVSLDFIFPQEQFGKLIKALSLCTYRSVALGGATVRLRGDELTLTLDEQQALDVLKSKATVTINAI